MSVEWFLCDNYQIPPSPPIIIVFVDIMDFRVHVCMTSQICVYMCV